MDYPEEDQPVITFKMTCLTCGNRYQRRAKRGHEAGEKPCPKCGGRDYRAEPKP